MKRDAFHIRKGHKGFVAVDPDIRFWAKVQKAEGDGCWIWTGSLQGKGYGSFYSDGKVHQAQRWIFERSFGAQPKSIHICHRCDKPRCVRLDHLFAGTRHDNMRDCAAKGRFFCQIHPEKSPRLGATKLTAPQVRELRTLRASGVVVKTLASKFGISEGYCFRILAGKAKTWANI